MCLELTNRLSYAKTVTAAELETLLAQFEIDVLADTIERHWEPVDRFAVLDWIAGMYAARRLGEPELAPAIPEVLLDIVEASRAIEA